MDEVSLPCVPTSCLTSLYSSCYPYANVLLSRNHLFTLNRIQYSMHPQNTDRIRGVDEWCFMTCSLKQRSALVLMTFLPAICGAVVRQRCWGEKKEFVDARCASTPFSPNSYYGGAYLTVIFSNQIWLVHIGECLFLGPP